MRGLFLGVGFRLHERKKMCHALTKRNLLDVSQVKHEAQFGSSKTLLLSACVITDLLITLLHGAPRNLSITVFK
jgi:hypothetical protein